MWRDVKLAVSISSRFLFIFFPFLAILVSLTAHGIVRRAPRMGNNLGSIRTAAINRG
jgi:hypothetical protein